MSDEPVDLDSHRSAAGQMATEIRRHSHREIESELRERRDYEEALAMQLAAEPARNWPEVAEKVRYLLRRYSVTADAQDARCRKLVERVLVDLDRLTNGEKTRP